MIEEKTVETSLSVKRSPGILTQAQVEWNITIPNHNPLQVAFNLEEKAHRTYQVRVTVVRVSLFFPVSH